MKSLTCLLLIEKGRGGGANPHKGVFLLAEALTLFAANQTFKISKLQKYMSLEKRCTPRTLVKGGEGVFYCYPLNHLTLVLTGWHLIGGGGLTFHTGGASY